MRCRSSASFLSPIGGRLHRRPRRQQTRSTARKLSSIVALFASIDPAAGAEIVTLPLLLAGLGIGALASQLGAVTVSSSITERDGDDPGHASSQP